MKVTIELFAVQTLNMFFYLRNDFPNAGYSVTGTEGDQNMLPQYMPTCHKDCLELKADVSFPVCLRQPTNRLSSRATLENCCAPISLQGASKCTVPQPATRPSLLPCPEDSTPKHPNPLPCLGTSLGFFHPWGSHIYGVHLAISSCWVFSCSPVSFN